MAGSPPTACRTPGCSGTCFPETGHSYCADCEAAHNQEQATRPKQEPQPRYTGNTRVTEHDRLIHSSTWMRKTSPTMRLLNPLCQRIFEDGSRCRYPSKEIHHLSADPKLFFTPSNLVALCKACHHKDQGESADTPRF